MLAAQRDGLTVEAACKSISKELLEIFNFALVWGRSTKYNPQRVGLSHILSDEDVLQIVSKTLVQQKHSKDYQQRVSCVCADTFWYGICAAIKNCFLIPNGRLMPIMRRF